MNAINFTLEEKEILVEKFKNYFDTELNHEIGQFEAEFLIDFVSENLGSYYYNRGLQDAQIAIRSKLDDIEMEIESLENQRINLSKTSQATRENTMLNHIMVGTNDIERSKSFYNAVLGVIGAREPYVHKNDTGQTRLFYTHDGSTFGVSEPIDGMPATPANGFTIGFVCNSPAQVKEFHDVAIANGGTNVEDPPGLRENSMGQIHLCYFLDPDGHKICGFHRPSA